MQTFPRIADSAASGALIEAKEAIAKIAETPASPALLLSGPLATEAPFANIGSVFVESHSAAAPLIHLRLASAGAAFESTAEGSSASSTSATQSAPSTSSSASSSSSSSLQSSSSSASSPSASLAPHTGGGTGVGGEKRSRGGDDASADDESKVQPADAASVKRARPAAPPASSASSSCSSSSALRTSPSKNVVHVGQLYVLEVNANCGVTNDLDDPFVRSNLPSSVAFLFAAPLEKRRAGVRVIAAFSFLSRRSPPRSDCRRVRRSPQVAARWPTSWASRWTTRLSAASATAIPTTAPAPAAAASSNNNNNNSNSGSSSSPAS